MVWFQVPETKSASIVNGKGIYWKKGRDSEKGEAIGDRRPFLQHEVLSVTWLLHKASFLCRALGSLVCLCAGGQGTGHSVG